MNKNIALEHYEKQVKLNNNILRFEFYGIPKEDNIDVTQINNRINDIFNTKNFGSEIDKIIYYVRMILNQYDEKSLIVEVKNLNDNYYSKINLNNKKVVEYKKIQSLKLRDSWKIQIEVKFNESDGFSIHIPNEFNSLNLLHSNEIYIGNIMSSSWELIKYINEMELLDNMYFDDEEKILIDIYQMFFNENPDFSKEKTFGKIQSMMFILQKYNISLPNQDNFYMGDSQKYPTSQSVNTIIKRLGLFGKVDSYRGYPVHISLKNTNDIIKISKLVNEFCKNYDDKDKVLNNISSILYVIDNSLSGAEINDILNYPYNICDKETERSIICLLKVIDEAINNEIENNSTSKQHGKLLTFSKKRK